MSMQPFAAWFPVLAQQECRVIYLMEDTGGVPADRYALAESYCDDRDCDCQRALVHVISEDSGRSACVINIGLDAQSGWQTNYIDDRYPRARFADAILDLVNHVVLADALYVARLRRHNEMVRAKLEGRPFAGVGLTREQVAQRIDERKRRYKALRRTQERRRAR